LLTACVSYWAKPSHKAILQKVLARSTDRLEAQGGLVVFINLRWYPLILELYCAGIAAVEDKRYDSLANIFYTSLGSSEFSHKDEYFVEAVAKKISDLGDVFKLLPEYDRKYTPMSEYLFKILQPKLDDILFIGKNYERSFDEFEIFFALVVADFQKQRSEHVWGPVGRFGWKHHRHNPPLSRIISEACALGENWEPLKAGLFGGNLERFNSVAEEYQQVISKLNWW
jgi:hypothetical protein